MDLISHHLDWNKIAEVGFTSLATLAAAYFGAKFAFDMQVRREASKQLAANVENAKLVVFTVRRFRGLFNTLLQDIAEPDVPFHDHYLILKPFPSLQVQGPTFAFDSLAFLLESNEALLFNLASLQREISATLDQVRQRSEMHYSIVQPAIEALQIELELETVPKDFPALLAKKLGPRLDATMESLTSQMVSGLKAGVERCSEVANELAEAIEELCPRPVKRTGPFWR